MNTIRENFMERNILWLNGSEASELVFRKTCERPAKRTIYDWAHKHWIKTRSFGRARFDRISIEQFLIARAK